MVTHLIWFCSSSGTSRISCGMFSTSGDLERCDSSKLSRDLSAALMGSAGDECLLISFDNMNWVGSMLRFTSGDLLYLSVGRATMLYEANWTQPYTYHVNPITIYISHLTCGICNLISTNVMYRNHLSYLPNYCLKWHMLMYVSHLCFKRFMLWVLWHNFHTENYEVIEKNVSIYIFIYLFFTCTP